MSVHSHVVVCLCFSCSFVSFFILGVCGGASFIIIIIIIIIGGSSSINIYVLYLRMCSCLLCIECVNAKCERIDTFAAVDPPHFHFMYRYSTGSIPTN